MQFSAIYFALSVSDEYYPYSVTTFELDEAPLHAVHPEPPLLVARRTSSLSSSCRVPSAQALMASGTTLLLPRYTSNSALQRPGDSMRMSGCACKAVAVDSEVGDMPCQQRSSRWW